MSESTSRARKPSVLIVGAGFGGIGAAIELTRSGYHDVTILEKASDLGGVWRENTYPGAACDVPSPLYSYSFEPNPHWSSRYSPQPEILAYMKRTATKYGIDELIQFDTAVSSASFDEATGRWQVETNRGVLEADVFVPAVGLLSRPIWPDIPGQNSFTGQAFHSATWDHDVDLTGKSVAVIGTGASAIQFVPVIQPTVGALTIFQRSAPWVMPQPQRTYTKAHHALFEKVPAAQALERRVLWTGLEQLQKAMTVESKVLVPALSAAAKLRLRRSVKDPVLRAKLTPDYPAGCKRVLFSNKYIPAVSQDNVSIVTEDITEITPSGVRTADGVEHPVDVIVYGTGFAATEFLAPMSIKGVGGQDLHEVWAEGGRAYYGLAVPGFPNMFVMYGPNTNLGSGSIISMLEPQAAYVRQAVQLLDKSGPSYVAVKPAVEERFDSETQARIGDSVWTQCTSWYRNAAGRVTTNWPGTVTEYQRRTKRLDPADYELTRI
jgi:cation diffusion facilitator CzcD-associated flavoprotein CzcO